MRRCFLWFCSLRIRVDRGRGDGALGEWRDGSDGVVFAVLFLLHWRAWGLREDLELTALERFVTKATMQEQAIQMGIAAVSVGAGGGWAAGLGGAGVCGDWTGYDGEWDSDGEAAAAGIWGVRGGGCLACPFSHPIQGH